MEWLQQLFTHDPLVAAPLALFVTATLSIAFSYWLESRFRWARRVGNVIILITIGIVLSNLNVVPFKSPVYDVTGDIGIPLSIALLLLRLDIADLKKLDRQCIGYFLLCCVGTIAGVVVSHLAFGDLIGPESWKLTGQLTASYIGGGENAVAVGKELQVSEALFSSTFAADNIVTAVWMLVCLSGPVGLGRFFSTATPFEISDAPKEHSKPFTNAEFLPSVFYSLSIAGIILLCGQWVAAYVRSAPWLGTVFGSLDSAFLSVVPLDPEFAPGTFLKYILGVKIIWVTTFALIVAQTPLKKHFKVSFLLGMLIFNYFFFSMGAISSLKEVMDYGPRVFVFVTTIVAVHGVIVLGVGKLIHANLPKLLTASQATIGGPATAAALAEANNWPHLVIPGVLMGILGYATANYIGFIIAFLMKAI